MIDNLKDVALEDLSIVFSDGDWIESKDQSESGIRLIQTGNIGVGFFKNRAEKARFISEKKFTELNCNEVHAGDILVSRLPDPVGRSCIVPNLNEKLITAVDCTIIRFDTKRILPKYFIYFSQSPSYMSQVEKLITGATRQRISRSNLGKILVPLPDIVRQQKIIDKFDRAFLSAGNAINLYERKIELIESLKISLLDEAF